jgi:hypothetical protein
MKCHYCQTFTNIPKSLRRISGDYPKPKISYRYCRHIHEEVTSNTETACNQFIPAPYFWCKQWSGWIHVVVCLVRRKRKILPCAYCKQYKEIEDISVGRDMFEIFGVKRKVIKVAKPNNSTGNKTVLKKRKIA